MERTTPSLPAWSRPPRPASLSDPYHEWSEAERRALLRTPDDRLAWSQLQALHGILPAGRFDEVAYFLPVTLTFLRQRSGNQGELIASFAHWISHHRDELVACGAHRMLVPALTEILDAWTSTFQIQHVEFGGRRHDDCVGNAQDVVELLHELLRYEVFAGVAEGYYAALARLASPVRAAWFLEVCRQQVDGPFGRLEESDEAPPSLERGTEIETLLDALEAGSDAEAIASRVADGEASRGPGTPARSAAALRLLSSRTLRERAVDVVWGSALHDPQASYWRDLPWYLGVER